MRKPPMKDGNPFQPPSLPTNLISKRQGNAEMEMVNQVRAYDVITPIFGGGAIAQVNDAITLVRGTTIRGQLRFWWRACRAAEFPTIAAMKEQEDAIWGSTEKPSSVEIEVRVLKDGKKEPVFSMEPGKKEPKCYEKVAAYAAFPMLPEDEEKKNVGWKSESVQIGVEFVLTLRYPKKISDRNITKDIDAALWAWETFGGVGARTRRGFGAIRLKNVNNNNVPDLNHAIIEQKIKEKLKEYVVEGTYHNHLPQLSHSIDFKITRVETNATDAWKELIKKLKKFRQERYENEYGASKWPEANRIKELDKLEQNTKEPSNTVLINKFPRAVFGLPIIFHIPQHKIKGITLEGVSHNRLASPLILRPLVCEGGKAVGLAAILQTEQIPPEGLILKGLKKNEHYPVSASLTLAEANQIEPLNGEVDVLKAFLKTLS